MWTRCSGLDDRNRAELFSELKNKAQFIEVSTIDGVSELSISN